MRVRSVVDFVAEAARRTPECSVILLADVPELTFPVQSLEFTRAMQEDTVGQGLANSVCH